MTVIVSFFGLALTGFIFTIHIFNTHFRPKKFPMDTVVFIGRMSIEELKHDRPRLYTDLVESGELEKNLVEPASLTFVKVVTLFGTVALVVEFTLVGLIVYAMLVSYR